MEERQQEQQRQVITVGTLNSLLRSENDDDDGACVYSRAVLVVDMVWNLAFVVVAAAVILSTFNERPSTPLRLWLCGYAFECLLHVAFVFSEFRVTTRDSFSHTPYSIAKKLEPMNTLASSVWWVFGFYWIVVGGQPLLEDSPRLYCFLRSLLHHPNNSVSLCFKNQRRCFGR